MMQTGLLDWQIRFKQLDKGGDPLPRIQTMVDWKLFRPLLGVERAEEAVEGCRGPLNQEEWSELLRL